MDIHGPPIIRIVDAGRARQGPHWFASRGHFVPNPDTTTETLIYRSVRFRGVLCDRDPTSSQNSLRKLQAIVLPSFAVIIILYDNRSRG